MTNIFREAKELLESKKDGNFTPEEKAVINAALLPILHLPHGEDRPLLERLTSLASLADRLAKNDLLPDAPPPVLVKRPLRRHRKRAVSDMRQQNAALPL